MLLTKLHPSLRDELARWQALARAGDNAPAPELEVVVYFSGDAAAIERAGLKPGFFAEQFVVGYTRLSALESLASLPEVQSIRRAPQMRPLLNESVPAINVPAVWNAVPGYKGRKVVVGVIDGGIDIGHKCFRRPADQHSRVLRLWDQTESPFDERRSPRRFTLPGINNDQPIPPERHGAEYTDDELTTKIQETPLAEPHHLPGIAPGDPSVAHHGTHVTGIAAGNGNQSDGCHGAGFYVGVAPEADIVFVRVTGKELSKIFHGLCYILQFAATASNFPENKPRPVVVNLSLGYGDSDSNPELNEILLKPFDALVSASASRVVVAASGNDANAERHAIVPLLAGNAVPAELKFKVPKKMSVPRELDLSFIGSTQLTVTLRSGAGAAKLLATPAGAIKTVLVDDHVIDYCLGVQRNVVGALTGALWIKIYPRALPPGAPEGTVTTIAMGEWTLGLLEPDGRSTLVDAWFRGYDLNPCPRFTNFVDQSNTLSSPARARNVIAVGAYDARASPPKGMQSGQLAIFSGHGRASGSLDELKPDVVAPGVGVISVRSGARKTDALSECCVNFYGPDDGTSMASPHVAGVVALMLERNRTLTFHEVRNILRTTAKPPQAGLNPSPGLLPNERWGFGIVDAAAAVNAVPISAADAAGTHAGTMVAGDVRIGPQPPGPPMEPDPVGPILFAPDAAPPEWTAPAPLPAFAQRLRALEPLLDRSPSLRLALALVSAHVDEIRALVSQNRRVAAVWRSEGGPVLMRHLLEAPIDAEPIIPAEIAGFSIRALLTRLLAILQRYGGERLRADVARHREFVVAAPGTRLEDLDELVVAGVTA